MRMECCLKKLCGRKGLAFEDLAAATGIDAEILEKIENGDFKALRKSTLIAICEAAHCQISDFAKVVPD